MKKSGERKGRGHIHTAEPQKTLTMFKSQSSLYSALQKCHKNILIISFSKKKDVQLTTALKVTNKDSDITFLVLFVRFF